RIGEQGAGNRQPLALTARQSDAALANNRFVAFPEAGDEAVRLRIARGGFDRLPIASLTESEADVLGDRAREEKDVLFDRRNLGPKRFQTPVADVDAINEDAP